MDANKYNKLYTFKISVKFCLHFSIINLIKQLGFTCYFSLCR